MDSELKPYIGRLCRYTSDDGEENKVYRIIGFIQDSLTEGIHVILQDFTTQSYLYEEQVWWFVLRCCDEWKRPGTWHKF